MTSSILTPLDFSDAVPAGRRRFWKQILPKTSINYDGQKIDFDDEFHSDLELAFKEKAFDQVPLVFADSGNRHNMDPRNFGGDIIDLQHRGDEGTWALIEADRAAARVIKKNPRLGVSARILQGVQKADGRSFKRAVNHVLLTMNPRVGGMAPWQAVDLSEATETDEVVDLTAQNYEGDTMGVKTRRQSRRRQIDLSALDDEQFQTLLDLATEAGVLDDEDVEDEEEVDEEEVEDTSTVKKPRKKSSKTKITVEKESEDDGDEDDEDEEEDDDESATDLSEAARRSDQSGTVRTMQIDLAEQRWQGERSEYLRAGVPPFLLDLAAPVLSSPDTMVIDLAEGETVNATEVVRKMVDGFKGLVDLTPDIGHSIDLSEARQGDEDKAFLDAWDEQYG